MALDFSGAIGGYISIAWRHMSAKMAKRLAPFGIGGGQFPILFILFIQDGLSQRVIAQRMAADKAAVTRAVSSLEGRGYVRRLADKRDKRAYSVRLTAKARRLRPRLEAAAGDILETMQAGLSEADRAMANRLLKVIAGNICGVKGQNTEPRR
jgi:MarR family transcriptional regulator for hemolysin